MNKFLMTAMVLAIAGFSSGCATLDGIEKDNSATWEGVKKDTNEAWDATKETYNDLTK